MRFFTLLTILLSITAFTARSQNQDGAVHLPDSIGYDQIIIKSFEITGNKLTKDWIIVRELDFKIGDTLSTQQAGKIFDFKKKRFAPGDSSELSLRMKYSRENIINTELFLTVNLSIQQIQENEYKMLIDVTERHYWWIFPVVKLNYPNFNEWLREPDFSDLSMGLFFSHNNLFGSSHQTSLVGYVGKSYAVAWGYKIPWIGKGRKTGLTFGAGYQNLYTVEYASKENERQMLYKSNSLQSANLLVNFKMRPGLYNYGNIKLTGEWVSVSDSLYSLDSNYLAKNKKSNTYLTFYADYAYDSRNSKTYPLMGSYLQVFVNKIGLGLISKDVDYFLYGVKMNFYQKLSDRWYVAEMFKLENNSGENMPYHYQVNLMYKQDFIRGYDLYTIKGDQMYYFRSNVKYNLVKPNIKKVKEGQEKNKFKNLQYAFYLNAFADAGYVVNNFTGYNPLNNTMLYSWGLGLDFVTYYDMVLRFEYAFTYNSFESKNGFFIAFGMPI
jgi:outer membrane protein assembly factor BamA